MRMTHFVATATLAVMLAACTPTSPVPSPTPVAESASPTPSPTPTPTPTPDPTITLITLTADTITLTDSSGAAGGTFDYFQPTEDLIVGLTAAFGFDPTVEDVQPYEGEAYSSIEWEGFILRDGKNDSDGVYYPNNRVTVTAPTVRGVTIETVDGISVGDDPSPIEAAHPDSISYGTNSGRDAYVIRYGVIPLPDFDFGYGQNGPFSYWVSLMGDVGGPVSMIYAPSGGGPGI